MPNRFILTIIYLCILQGFLLSREGQQILLSDSFNKMNQSWHQIIFDENVTGKISTADGLLKIKGTDSLFGIYNDRAVKGHFIVDLEFVDDRNVGLALIRSNEGKPDLKNFTMLCVDNEDGFSVVYVRDRQNGINNVLDFTGKTNFESDIDDEKKELNIGPDLYKHVLSGKQYSVPFSQTNKKIRIFREDNAGFFHYYYQVSKEYNGKKFIDWMELRPSPDWSKPGSEFFIAVLSLHKGETALKAVEARQKPTGDKSDLSTGFKVTQREYNWSGFMGDAYVVSFDNSFPFHDRDIKFVFWTEMNYIPAWHLNNQLLYTYEFVETWDEDVPGCHEPMSDRLRQWTRVKVLEDNAVRKVLQWHYVLANPNYQVPAEGEGEQLPEVDEFWTIYPDGTGTRRIEYRPKLDCDFRAPHELGELISIAGSKANSEDFYASPALTMMNLNGQSMQAHPGPKFDYYSAIDSWKQQILNVHFKKEPDVYCVWSDDPAFPETYSGYPIRFENAWQNPHGKIVHWPVNKRPYTSAYAAGGTWKGEVSHACLLSWGVRDGIDWTDHFKEDLTGRKYREWVSLIGLNHPDDTTEVLNRSRTWIYKGEVDVRGRGISFLGKDVKENLFVFDVRPDCRQFSIRFIPEKQNARVINPVLKIKNWVVGNQLKVGVDGEIPAGTRYRTTLIGTDLLIWLKARLGPAIVISLEIK